MEGRFLEEKINVICTIWDVYTDLEISKLKKACAKGMAQAYVPKMYKAHIVSFI